jgi:hypothetical protein
MNIELTAVEKSFLQLLLEMHLDEIDDLLYDTRDMSAEVVKQLKAEQTAAMEILEKMGVVVVN